MNKRLTIAFLAASTLILAGCQSTGGTTSSKNSTTSTCGDNQPDYTGAFASGVIDYTGYTATQKAELLGSMEGFAMKHNLAGIPIYDDAGYEQFSSRVQLPTTTYIPNYGFGVGDGSLNVNANMWKYVIKRILLIFLTTFIILSLTYILLQTLPVTDNISGFTARLTYWNQQCALGYYYKLSDAEVLAGAKAAVSFTDTNGTSYYFAPYPVLHRYVVWLSNIFTRWDWGTSIYISVNRSAMISFNLFGNGLRDAFNPSLKGAED